MLAVTAVSIFLIFMTYASFLILSVYFGKPVCARAKRE